MDKGQKQIIKEFIMRNKDAWFVTHIETHLKEMPELNKGKKVCCKICNKDIDTIAKEQVNKMMDAIKYMENKQPKEVKPNSSHN